MTDLGWGAYVNCKKKLERFLGRDIPFEPERKGTKSRALEIKDERQDKVVRDLELKLDERERIIERMEKRAEKDLEKQSKVLGGLADMIKGMKKQNEDEAIKEQQRINYEMMQNYMNETQAPQTQAPKTKGLNIDELERALQEQYKELEFD